MCSILAKVIPNTDTDTFIERGEFVMHLALTQYKKVLFCRGLALILSFQCVSECIEFVCCATHGIAIYCQSKLHVANEFN